MKMEEKSLDVASAFLVKEVKSSLLLGRYATLEKLRFGCNAGGRGEQGSVDTGRSHEEMSKSIY